MKAIMLLCMFVLVQAFASASSDCYSSFLDEYQIEDSKSFVVRDENLESDFDLEPESYVKEAVNSVISKVQQCSEVASNVSDFKSNENLKVVCKELVPGLAHSKSCYVESELGYFFFSQDMLGKVNLIYNRWD